MAQLGQTVSMYQNLNTQNTNINEVAFSGSYTDLANTPVISTIGHSGQYSDILNPPTRVSQFANDANYAVIGQKVSEFQNDAQYTVNGSNISQFANNSNYAVRGENVSEFANNANYVVHGDNVNEFANNSNYTPTGSNVSQFNNDPPYATVSQLNSATANNGNYYSSGSNAYFNEVTINQSAPGLQAGIAGFTAPGQAGIGFGANGIVQVVGNGIADCMDMQCHTTSSIIQIGFYNPNGAVGHITTSGSATSYNTSSDYRLKDNVTPMVDCLDRLMKLNPVTFKFKKDEKEIHDGFIAHEVQEICPRAVTGIKDAVDEEGEIVPQSVDLSKLVPLLVDAVQKLSDRIKELEVK